MKSIFRRIPAVALAAPGLLLLAACASPVATTSQPPLPPPPDDQTLEILTLEPPSLAESLAPEPAEPEVLEDIPPRQLRPGVLPGVDQTELPFEHRLQQRQQRVNLGLDRPQREQEPVDNLLDLEF